MLASNPLPDQLIQLKRNPDYPHIYDVELNRVSELKRYSSVDCHIVIYPYSRAIRSPQLVFNPFDEYIKDISTRRRSLYTPIPASANSLFGIFLGLLIVLAFSLIKPEDVISVQSIISILGAYFIGKDLWDDIENWLVNWTHDLRLRYQTGAYQYQMERNTTLTGYFALARVHRYGKASLLPERMDLLSNSNSKTLRILFRGEDLASFAEPSAHILSLRVEPGLVKQFEAEGYMFGIKLCLNERRFVFRRSHEYFQSLSKHERGCLNTRGEWVPEAALQREVLWLYNLRYLISRQLLSHTCIIASE